jgi:hypothetical protein
MVESARWCGCELTTTCQVHGEMPSPRQAEERMTEILRLRGRINEIANRRDTLEKTLKRLHDALTSVGAHDCKAHEANANWCMTPEEDLEACLALEEAEKVLRG